MTDKSKKCDDLTSLIDKAITGHPGYEEFAVWCESQLIYPYQIYFLIWQASRDAVEIRLRPEDCLTFQFMEYERSVGFKEGLEFAGRRIESQGMKVEK